MPFVLVFQRKICTQTGCRIVDIDHDLIGGLVLVIPCIKLAVQLFIDFQLKTLHLNLRNQINALMEHEKLYPKIGKTQSF